VRPTHSENASQTDTESDDPFSSDPSRVRCLAISQRRRFSRPEGDGFRRYPRLDDDHSFLDIVSTGEKESFIREKSFLPPRSCHEFFK